MPRAYLPAKARCNQLERLVRQQPGLTIGELAHLADLAYRSACAYIRRLVREGRVQQVAEEPAAPRGSLLRFYPLQAGADKEKKAA